MKKFLTTLCALVLALTCAFSLFTGALAADEGEQTTSIVDYFADAASYANHYHGTFGGVTRVDDGSVRVLVQKSSNASSSHYGFMVKKDIIKSLVDDGYQTLSFKVTTEAYGSGEVAGFVDVYASSVSASGYQLSLANGTYAGGSDVYYASGTVVEIDLAALYNTASFTEGLKFVLTKTAAWDAATASAYLVLSDFKTTKAAKTPFEQMTFEKSYESYANGEFGGVTTVDENSVQILAKEKDGVAGFMLTTEAIERILLMRANEMTVTLNASAYDSGSVPTYVVLDSSAATEYVVDYKTVAAKVDGTKLYFTPGTTITIRLEKLYPHIAGKDGLKFALLSGDTWESGGATAYLTLDDLVFAEKMEDLNMDLVTTTGDFTGNYAYEETWEKMTEKAIRAAAEAGFKYIDLSLYRLRGVDAPADKKPNGWEDDLMKEGWEDSILRIKAVAEELGVEFRMSHSPGYAGFGSAEWVEVNKRSIDICQMLGIENLVVHATTGTSKENCFEVNATHYVKLLPYAAERGINILCENSTMKNVPAGKWFFTTGADMRELIELVQAQGYSNFHGCWDTGHANCEGSQYLDILAMGDEIYGIHFNDNMANGDTHMIPYYGTMDVDEVMRALKVIGYPYEFTLEVDGSGRMGTAYTGPELEGVEDYYPADRFQQEILIFKICTNILETYNCGSCETHDYSDWQDTGNGKHTRTCATCGKVALVSHTPDKGNVAKEPTCKEEGQKTRTCTACGFVSTETLEKTENHNYTGDCDDSCNVCGASREVTHNYAAATCTAAKTCKACGATSGSALGHNYAAATCTAAKTCKTCGATSGSKLGHIYSNDCDTKCNRCYAERTVGDHRYTNSCDAQCDSCGAWRTASHTYSNDCDKTCNVCGTTRSVGAHKYSNDCDTTCNTCGAKRTVSHSYSAATCTKAKTCEVCGATSGSALGHNYAAATCTKAKTCKTCGATSGKALGHSYETTTKKATLKKNGSIVKECTECGKVASETTIKRVKTVKLSKTSYTYNGKVKTPSVTVKDSAGKTLKKGTDYTVTYQSGRKNAGTYKVTVKMMGNYTGTKTLTFKIKPIDIDTCSIKLSAKSYTYNGKVKTPSVTVKNAGGTTLKKGTHYTVTYEKGRKNVGTYEVTVTMKGNYSGEKTLTFKINPKKTTVKKLTSANDALKVSIDKETKQVTGYQVQYSTSKTFKKATTKTVKSYKTTSLTLKKLKSDKKYYVRVRTYKTVDGTRYYSGWSSYKTARTK